MPLSFINEMFVLARDGVDFEVSKIPGFMCVVKSLISSVGRLCQCFFNLITSVRQHNQQFGFGGSEPRMDPLQAEQTPVDEMVRHAYVDPNDWTRIFLQQPDSRSQLRRRTYQSHSVSYSESSSVS